MQLIQTRKRLKVLIYSIFLMVPKNNMRTVPGALALILLSVIVVSVVAISSPDNVSGQELPGAQQADAGLASLDDTTAGQPGGGAESSPCTPAEIGGASGQNATTTNATTTARGTTTNTTVNNTAMLGGEAVSPSSSQIRDHIEQACIALEVGDTEGALMQLDFALDELGGGGDDTQGNDTTTSLSEGEEGGFNEGVSVGGTGPIDDYDATPDAEAG
jgi:hypothetical protein